MPANADPATGAEEQRLAEPRRERVSDERADEIGRRAGKDRGDQASGQVAGRGEHAAGRHDDLAGKRKAAALEDHEDEHGEEPISGDELAEGGRQTVWTVVALTARKGSVRTCWSSTRISKL